MDHFTRAFGTLISCIIPGFIVLVGLAPIFPIVALWLEPAEQEMLGVGPTVYALIAATGMGMVVGCFRWLIVDHVHEWTGITPAPRNYAALETKLAAVDHLIQSHYRYYQFYANTLVALVWAYALNRSLSTVHFLGPGTDLGMLILCAALFAGSRDTLTKYRKRTRQLLTHIVEKGNLGEAMTNGMDHHPETPAKVRSENKTTSKPAATGKPDAGKNKNSPARK